MRNIVLTGIMGCGKSCIGKELATKLNMDFCDMDKMVEDTQKMSINEIFAAHGEVYFRTVETEMCKQAGAYQSCVISTGGGVVLNEKNMEYLKSNGVIVYINRPIDMIVSDIDVSGRPLLKDTDVKKKLNDLLLLRGRLYEEYADIEIINDKELEEIVDKIILEVGRYENSGN